MFQYAKKFFTDKIKKEKELEFRAIQNRNDINIKMNRINKYNQLKKDIKDIKIEIAGIIALMIIITGLFLSFGLTSQVILLAAFYDAVVAAFFLPKKFRDLKKYKKEYNGISKEEINELKEKEESMRELSKTLENEINSRQDSINQYKDELGKISEMEKVEEAKSKNTMNNAFYQADTEEEYHELLDRKEKCEMAFDEFLNEKVDYEDVHLGVRKIENPVKCLVKKK